MILNKFYDRKSIVLSVDVAAVFKGWAYPCQDTDNKDDY